MIHRQAFAADRSRLRYRSAMPARRAVWLRRLAIAAAAVVALLAGVVALFPLFVDGDRVRHALERRISDVAGGEVSYDSLKLRFFPQPRAEIRNATVRIPGAVDGRIGTLAIRVAALPLLAGDVSPGRGRDHAAGARGHDRTGRPRWRSARRVSRGARPGRGRPGAERGRDVARNHGRQARRPLRRAARPLALRPGRRRAGRDGRDHCQGERQRGPVRRTARASVRIVPGSLAATGTLQTSGLRLPAGAADGGRARRGQSCRGRDRCRPRARDRHTARASARRSPRNYAADDARTRGTRTLALGFRADDPRRGVATAPGSPSPCARCSSASSSRPRPARCA